MKTFEDFMIELDEAYEKATPQEIRKTARERSRAMKRRNIKPQSQVQKDRAQKQRKDDTKIKQSARNKVLKDIIPGYADLDPLQKAKKKEQKKDRIDREVKKMIPKVKRAEPERIKKHKETLKTRPARKKAEKERAKKK